MQSQFQEDRETMQARAADAQHQAAEALEFLRIRQQFPTLQMNEADQQIIRDYFEPEMVTLAGFIEAYAIEKLDGRRQTLRQMLCPPKTAAQVKQDLRALTHDQLQQKAREEAVAKAANRNNPVVQQIEPGVPILPAHWTRKYIKAASSEEIRSARIRFDRETGKPGSFNDALTARLQGADAQEVKRLYNLERGE